MKMLLFLWCKDNDNIANIKIITSQLNSWTIIMMDAILYLHI